MNSESMFVEIIQSEINNDEICDKTRGELQDVQISIYICRLIIRTILRPLCCNNPHFSDKTPGASMLSIELANPLCLTDSEVNKMQPSVMMMKVFQTSYCTQYTRSCVIKKIETNKGFRTKPFSTKQRFPHDCNQGRL
ncbi:hypothetical protein YC2023_030686 [Brassica napus]